MSADILNTINLPDEERKKFLEYARKAFKISLRLNLTIDLAADALGIGEPKVLKLIDEGKLGVVYIDGVRYIPKKEIERFLTSNTVWEKPVLAENARLIKMKKAGMI